MRYWLTLPALLAAASASGCLFGRPSPSEEYAKNLEPATLHANPTPGGAVGTARIRFYVDDDYRAQNADYQAKIRLLVERAGKLLEPTIGVHLQVVDIQPWHRASGDRKLLETSLEELEALDPGEDVDLVIGLVDALSRVSLNLHELGLARMLGRHAVLRGLDDATEVAVRSKGLGGLRKGERERLYSRRKRHKETVIFLHEVAHTFGGIHVTGERDILNPTYDHLIDGFGRDNAQLMRAVAAARLARGSTGAPEWRQVRDLVRDHPSESWNEDEKATLLADLEIRAQGTDEKETPGETLSEGVRSADRERFRAAERLHAAGRPLDAWEDLEPLLDFYPEEPAVQRLACRLAVAAERDRAAIESRCARAAQVAPDDADPHLRLAQAYLAAGDKGKATREAKSALDLLERTGADAGPLVARLAGDLAAHFQALGAVTWAEKAAAKAADPKPITAWARKTRVRFGLAPGGPVAPEREADYIAAITDLLGDVYARRFAEADRRAAQIQRSFRGAAGIDAALCDLEVRRGRYPMARAHCREAIRRFPDSAWAHYLTGLLDKRDKKPTAAVDHLERAVALDPELRHAYQVAAEIYRELGRAGDVKRLGDAYQAQFKQALP